MWGREARAGLIFVLLSLAAGGAVRGWQRSHEERFDEIVASLVAPPDLGDLGDRGDRGDSSADPEAVPDSGAPRVLPARAVPGARPRRAAEALLPASIDVDRATAEELVRLPGIGPSLAGRIVAEREAHGPFGGAAGLLRVTGIGPKTLEKIRPYLTP